MQQLGPGRCIFIEERNCAPSSQTHEEFANLESRIHHEKEQGIDRQVTLGVEYFLLQEDTPGPGSYGDGGVLS